MSLPTRYGRYILLEKIGQGGMAEVFRAVSPGSQGFQRIVVVKRILPQLCRDDAFVRMFIDEAKLSALISHPNVVQVFEFGRFDETYFLAMEFVNGRNFASILERLAQMERVPPVDIVVEIVRQACLGLDHAHNMTGGDGQPLRLVHRDVTPANVMVGYNGGVKLLDFGIASAAEITREHTTSAGPVKGKIAYLAPEQILQKPLDRRSDIFAVGIVLHEGLTGRRLFKSDNHLATVKMILESTPTPPSETNPGSTAALDAIVARALARDPDERYQTAHELAVDLEGFLIERRFTSQRLPAFMHELFATEIKGTRERLLTREERMLTDLGVWTVAEEADGLRTPAPGTPPVATALLREGGAEAAAAAMEEATSPRSAPTPAALAAAGGPVEAATSRPQPRRRVRRRHMALGGGALLTAAALTSLALTRGGSSGTQPKAASAAAPSEAPAARLDRAAAPTGTPEPQVVRVSLDSFPQGATVTRASDASVLGRTPITVTLPRATEPLALVFARAGFANETIRVIPDLDKPAFARLSAIANGRPTTASATRAEKRRSARPRAASGKRERGRSPLPLDPFEE